MKDKIKKVKLFEEWDGEPLNERIGGRITRLRKDFGLNPVVMDKINQLIDTINEINGYED